MRTLALEFSSARRTVAAGDAQGSCVRPLEQGGTPGGAFEVIAAVLREAGLEREQIECLAVGLGPGSYNGIRSAIATAQGWELAGGTRLRGVSSADCLVWEAQTAGLLGRVNVVIDAQRSEFYLGRYDVHAGNFVRREPLRLATLEEVRALAESGEILVGSDVNKWIPTARQLFPSANALISLGERCSDFTPGEKLEPVYLREANFVKAPAPRPLP